MTWCCVLRIQLFDAQAVRAVRALWLCVCARCVGSPVPDTRWRRLNSERGVLWFFVSGA